MLYIFAQLLDFFDKAYAAIVTTGVERFLEYAAAPLDLAVSAWVFFRGYRLLVGSIAEVASDVVRELLGLVIIVSFITNADYFNDYVTDFFFYGLPQTLSAMAIQIAGVEGNQVTPATYGAELTVLWAEVWKVAGLAWQSLGMNIKSAVEIVMLPLMLIFAAIGLVVCAVVYIISHFFLLVIVIMGPVFLGTALFSATRPFFERWIGKCVALILLQVMSILILAVVCAACQLALAGITAKVDPDPIGNLEAILGVVVIFSVAAIMMYYLPQFAYSLGSGIAITEKPSVPKALGGKGSGDGLGLSSDLKISMNPAAMQQGGSSRPAALPPPPPRALGSS